MPNQIKDLPSLLAAVGRGEQLKYLFFWGHQASPTGEITKSCFSQWWPALFEVEGTIYPSAEHFMMAEKARLFGDEEVAAKILATAHPREAKNLGRMVANYDDALWEQQRFAIVVAGNLAKFSQNPALQDFLLSTSPRILVEASPQDTIWGIGLSERDLDATNPEKWRGLNLLGFALMRMRAELAQHKTPS